MTRRRPPRRRRPMMMRRRPPPPGGGGGTRRIIARPPDVLRRDEDVPYYFCSVSFDRGLRWKTKRDYNNKHESKGPRKLTDVATVDRPVAHDTP